MIKVGGKVRKVGRRQTQRALGIRTAPMLLGCSYRLWRNLSRRAPPHPSETNLPLCRA